MDNYAENENDRDYLGLEQDIRHGNQFSSSSGYNQDMPFSSNNSKAPFLSGLNDNLNYAFPTQQNVERAPESEELHRGRSFMEDLYELENPFVKSEYSLGLLGSVSLLLLFSSAVQSNVYGIVTSLLSILAVFIQWIHQYYPYNIISQYLPPLTNLYASVFFAVLWSFALVILTNFTKFSQLSNGFIAVWLGFGCSIGMLHQQVKSVQDMTTYFQRVYNQSKPVGLLIITSFIELLAAVSLCVKHTCAGGTSFSIALGVVSLAICIYIVLSTTNRGSGINAIAVGFLPCWWLLGVIVSTFTGPFVDKYSIVVSLNGFFGTWSSFFAAVWLFAAGKKS